MPSLSFVTSLTNMLVSEDAKRVNLSSNPFLKCDQETMNRNYYNETIEQGIFYKTLINDVDFTTKDFDTVVTPGVFDRNKSSSLAWQEQSKKVFDAFLAKKPNTKNGRMIHPVTIDVANDKINFNVQECGYFDQVATHLGLDYKEKTTDTSLREMLSSDYPGLLPPVEDGRLSNSFGVGMMLFYKHENEYVPCVFRRVQNVAIAGGSVNGTASGAVDWPASNNVGMPYTLEERIVTELKEETGLTKDDISNLAPVALTQEYNRAGKQQAFYVATTELTRDEIVTRFKNNIAVSKKSNSVEFTEELMAGRIDVLPRPQVLYDFLSQTGMGPEGVANMHYALPYLQRLETGK